ncbi:MAG: acyl carrier protein [Clostridia bacterium]|nr:acyl carrier protein [Clostridia bacterium]MBQ9481990.1 acyl carrier protein [Clostridia bacterium]
MTFEKIQELLAQQLNIDKNTITENSEIIKDLGADSLDIVEMLMGLEDQFGIEVSEDEAVNLKTVGDIVKVIDSKIK